MQAVWDLEQGKYGFGMFTYSIFFASFSPVSLFSLCCVGLGMTWGFADDGLLICMKCLGLWLKGLGEGETASIRCIAIFYYMCAVGEVVEGRGGGEMQLQCCQNMIKPKHKGCGASHRLVLSPQTHFLL